MIYEKLLCVRSVSNRLPAKVGIQCRNTLWRVLALEKSVISKDFPKFRTRQGVFLQSSCKANTSILDFRTKSNVFSNIL